MQAVFPSRRDMNMHAVRLPHPAELIRDEGTAVEYKYTQAVPFPEEEKTAVAYPPEGNLRKPP